MITSNLYRIVALYYREKQKLLRPDKAVDMEADLQLVSFLRRFLFRMFDVLFFIIVA